MMRLQLRTRLVGILLATALADGAALTLATRGSSSPDASANTAKTAERLARLHTRPKTAPASRAFKELCLDLNDCMMESNVCVSEKNEARNLSVSGPRGALARGGAAVYDDPPEPSPGLCCSAMSVSA